MIDVGYPDLDYGARIRRALQAMGEHGIDALVLSVGRDMPYLLGYEAMPSERLTMAVIRPDRRPVLVVPVLEAPRVDTRSDVFTTHAWTETEDPVAIVAAHVGDATRIALGSQTWSTFLLALQRRVTTPVVDAAPLMRELRMVKDDIELTLLRAAGAAVDRVAARLRDMTFSGRTERSLAYDIATMTVEEGHQTATFSIVAAGPSAASPHHEPGDRIIERGDTVVVDFGGRWHGYGSDTTRTFVVGEPAEEIAAAHAVLHEAQRRGVDAVRPGITASSIDRITRDVIEAAGHGDHFIHRTGHGIGLDGHEHPYLVEGDETILEPGMTFSVEPGIYVPGEWGMRIEDIVAVTEHGVESFNHSDRSLMSVG